MGRVHGVDPHGIKEEPYFDFRSVDNSDKGINILKNLSSRSNDLNNGDQSCSISVQWGD